MQKRTVLTCLLVALSLAGCAAGDGDDSAGGNGDPRRLHVVAAFYPLAFAAQEIGGAGVEVANVTPPGAEPHDVELSARTVERVRSADVVLYLGRGFQPALEQALDGAGGDAVDLVDGVALLDGLDHDHGHGRGDVAGAQDPHVWLDPLRYAQIAERIGTVLGRERAARAFVERLRELDAELERGLARCGRRELVTSHAAFGYLAERYGLEQLALSGLSPEAEPTPRALERLAAEIRETAATTVFVEPLASPRVAETVARETGTRTAVLNPIEGLTEDDEARGEDYFSLMRANLEELREALGCR